MERQKGCDSLLQKWPEAWKSAGDYKKDFSISLCFKTNKEDLIPTAQGRGIQKQVPQKFIIYFYFLLFYQLEWTSEYIVQNK